MSAGWTKQRARAPSKPYPRSHLDQSRSSASQLGNLAGPWVSERCEHLPHSVGMHKVYLPPCAASTAAVRCARSRWSSGSQQRAHTQHSPLVQGLPQHPQRVTRPIVLQLVLLPGAPRRRPAAVPSRERTHMQLNNLIN